VEVFNPMATSSTVFLNMASPTPSTPYVDLSPAQKVLRARFSYNTSNIDGGKIRMLRRLAF
jgi:hypothetical protein